MNFSTNTGKDRWKLRQAVIGTCAAILQIFLAQPAVAFIKTVGGDNVLVSEDGHMILEDGQVVAVWGLEIQDVEGFRDLLSGRRLSCSVLNEYEGVLYSDCTLQDRNNLETNYSTRLDMYVWLPAFGLATYKCGEELPPSDRYNGFPAVRIDEKRFICMNGSPDRGVPIR